MRLVEEILGDTVGNVQNLVQDRAAILQPVVVLFLVSSPCCVHEKWQTDQSRFFVNCQYSDEALAAGSRLRIQLQRTMEADLLAEVRGGAKDIAHEFLGRQR